MSFRRRWTNSSPGLFPSANVTASPGWKYSAPLRAASRIPAATSTYWLRFRPDIHLGWDFFELHKELEDILGCKVDLLTRRSVEQDQNSIRRRSILQSTREIYAA
jgi:hypothetical protein